MPRKAKGVENEIKTNQEPETNVNLSVSSSKKTSKTSSSVDKKTSTSKKGATKSAETKKSTTKSKKGTVVSSLTGIPASDVPTTTKKSTTSKKSSLESKKDTTAVKTTKSSSKKAETSATSKDKTKATSSKKVDTKATSTKKTTAKKATAKSTKAATATKKTTAKKAPAKKTATATEKSAAKSTKATTAKEKKETSSSGRAMLAPTKKATAKKTATKSTTKTKSKKGTVVSSLTGIPTNGAPTIKTTAKKKSTTRKTTTKKIKTEEILEYYDLPYRYNETIVKILAQTPKKLFIYWDISDNDRKNYVEKFGDEFFNNTVPVLIVHNASQNYTFEVEINDFANCWYLDINDAKCEYNIELGRRSKNQHFSIPNNYIYVTSSNVIESPNDHILFEKQTKTVYFRNVKTNATHSKDIANISFIRNMGKIYNIYDAYKKLYNKMYSDEDIIDINNPSSSNPTSTFK